jgi:pilus assembly protein CpaB
MATRFGAASPAQTYATKVRWLVGCLVSVILVLIVAVVIIAQNTDAKENTSPAGDPIIEQPIASGMIDVLVADSRIEEGTELRPRMFRKIPMDPDKTPMAVIRAKDLESIIGKYASRLVNANMPIVLDDVSDNPPLRAISIPPGYRAVSIEVDLRQGVEGFAKPNSRVDILWTYSKDGRKEVATIARFVKVLSFGGNTSDDGQRVAVSKKGSTVTLLVTEKDAKKIELARSLGTLSLSLVGESETHTTGGEPDSITIQDLIGRPATTQTAEVANDGVMYTSDPRSGRQLRYVLRNGRWALDRSFTGGE